MDTKAASREPDSSLFKLTAPAVDSAPTTGSHKSILGGSEDRGKRDNRFDTPGQLQKIEESDENRNPYSNHVKGKESALSGYQSSGNEARLPRGLSNKPSFVKSHKNEGPMKNFSAISKHSSPPKY